MVSSASCEMIFILLEEAALLLCDNSCLCSCLRCLFSSSSLLLARRLSSHSSLTSSSVSSPLALGAGVNVSFSMVEFASAMAFTRSCTTEKRGLNPQSMYNTVSRGTDSSVHACVCQCMHTNAADLVGGKPSCLYGVLQSVMI